MNRTTLRRLAGLPLAATLVVCASLWIAAAASAQKATKAEIQTVQQPYKIKDTNARVAALESFLETDPQSANNRWFGDTTIGDVALDILIRIFQSKNRVDDKSLSGVNVVLELYPNNLHAIYYALLVRKSQCEKTGDPQSCNDAMSLARRGVVLPRAHDISNNDWKDMTILYQSLTPGWQTRYASKLLAINAAAKAEQQAKDAATQAEQQAKNAEALADQQARYDKVMNGGRPAQLYALAGQLQAEGRPEMAADLYQALIDNFPDDPYTAKAIDKQEAMRAAAQQPAQPMVNQPAQTDTAQQQAASDCQQQCSAALTACKSDAKGQVKTGVAMGVLGKLMKTTSVADAVTSVGSSAVDSFGACNDAYTSCTAACQ
jgi:hypothetical protein